MIKSDAPRGSRLGRPRQRAEPLGIGAVDQALDVVDALARSEGPRSLTELSRETGMMPSKLHRYLVSLCQRGLVKQIAASGLYDLGPGALSLGVISLARLDDFDVLREAADLLSRRFNQSSFVYVWSQAGPVLVHNRKAADALVNLRLGSIARLVESATGPVFLAYVDEVHTAPLLARDAAAEDLEPVATARRMRDEICPRIREDRVYWSDVTIVPRSAACAAPVFDAQGDILCVIGVSIYRRTREAERPPMLVEAVRDTAAAASRALGYTPSRRVALPPGGP